MTAGLIASKGLPSMLSDDQEPFVFGYCAAAALYWIFAPEEGIIVPFMFGFVIECLDLAAAFATLLRPSIFSLGLSSCFLVWFFLCL